MLCPTLAQPLPIGELASQVIADLCTLPTKDPFFKCIVWPTFIAGAETEAPEQRDAVRRLFHDFLLEVRSENVANAAAVLEEIWRRSDREKEQGDTGRQSKNGGWTDHLAKEGANWLFI